MLQHLPSPHRLLRHHQRFGALAPPLRGTQAPPHGTQALPHGTQAGRICSRSYRPQHRSRQCSPNQTAATTTVTEQKALELPPELADFRPNVGVCVINGEGLVFAATRMDDPALTWQMPQGGIDPGEAPLQAAIRELREETNISSVELLAEMPRWAAYEFPTAVRCRLHGSWAHYRGQAQRWFLFKFTGEDSEVDLDTEHREFSSWRWMPLEELPGSVVAFKRGVYEEVAEEFAPAVAALRAAAGGGG